MNQNEILKGLASALNPTSSEPLKRKEYYTLSLEEKVDVFFNDNDALSEVLLNEIESVIWKSTYSSELERRARVLKTIAYFIGQVKNEQ